MTNERLEFLQTDPRILPLGNLIALLSFAVSEAGNMDAAEANGMVLDGESLAWRDSYHTIAERYIAEINRREEEYKGR